MVCRFSNACRCVVDMEGVEYDRPVADPPAGPSRTELIMKLVSTDAALVNWDYVSQLKLSVQEYESFKTHLNWEIASRKIKFDTVNMFAAYVNWDVFEEAHVRRVVKDARRMVDQVRDQN